MYSLFGITGDVCSTLWIGTVLYSPGCCRIMLVLEGVALGVVTDCDLLSADTTSTTHTILMSAEMWTHITQHHNIMIFMIHNLCTWNCEHGPSPSLLPPFSTKHVHIMMLMSVEMRATASTRCQNNSLNYSGLYNDTPTNLWVCGCHNNLECRVTH